MLLRSMWSRYVIRLAWIGVILAQAFVPASAQSTPLQSPLWSNTLTAGEAADVVPRVSSPALRRKTSSDIAVGREGLFDANPTVSITTPTSRTLWVFRFGAFTYTLHNNNPYATKFNLSVTCGTMFACNPAPYDTVTVPANGNATVYANFVTGATPATSYTVTLSASYLGTDGLTHQSSASGSVTVPSGPVVTPKSGSLIMEPGTSTTIRFDVASNPSSAGGSFDPESPICGDWSCFLNGWVTAVPANGTGYINVTVTAPSSGAGPGYTPRAVRVGATARGSDGPIANDSGTVLVTLAYHTPTLSPRTGSLSVGTAPSRTEKFVLKNDGNSAATYDLTASCGAFGACSPNVPSVVLNAGDTTTISVTYAALQATSATIQLRANVRITGSMPAAADTARLTVTTTDLTAPTLTISPANNTTVTTRSTSVTVSVCDPDGIVTEPSGAFNGYLVLGTYTPATRAGCATAGSSVFELVLEPGSNTFYAMTDDGYHSTGVSQEIVYDETLEQKPVVTTALPSALLKEGQTRVDSFTVRNPGELSSMYAITVSCAAQLTACSAPVSSVTLAPGQSRIVPVSFTTTTAGGVWPITLTASYTGVNSTTVSSAVTSWIGVDVQAPSISISPADEAALSQPPTIVVQWCDPDGTFASRHVHLDGTLLTDNLTLLTVPGCGSAGTSTWPPLSMAPGAHTIIADATDAVGHVTTVTSTFTTSVPALTDYRPEVSPKGGTITSGIAASVSRYFTVRNAGIYTATYQLASICPFVSCQLSKSIVTLAPGGLDSARLTYVAPPVATQASVGFAATFSDGPGRVIADTGGILASTMTQANMSIPQIVPGAAALVLSPNSSQFIGFAITNTGTIAADYSILCATFGATFNWATGKVYYGGGGVRGCSETDHDLLHVEPQQTITVNVAPVTPSQGGVTGRVTLFVDNFPADGSHVGMGAHTEITTTQLSADVAVAPAASIALTDTVRAGALNLQRTFTILNSGTGPNTYHYGSPVAWAADCQGVAQNCHIVSGPTSNFGLDSGATRSVTVGYDATGPTTGTSYIAITAFESSGRSALGRVFLEAVGASTVAVGAVVSGSAPAFVAGGDSSVVTFAVQNAGASAGTFSYVATCGGVAHCTGTTSGQVTLAGGASGPVSIHFSMDSGTGGTGTITLTATSLSDPSRSASITHTVQQGVASPVSVNLYAKNPGVSISRDQCLSVSAGAGAAYECGELRLVHALPTTTTMNTAHTPALTYNSEHANPRAIVNADVTVQNSLSPHTVRAVLTLPGVGKTMTRDWSWDSTWQAGIPRRISINVDAIQQTLATGVYPYALQVQALDASNSTLSTSPTQYDTLVIVSRVSSPYGRGWWLDGLEQLSTATADSADRLWIGSDGSTRIFRRVSPTLWIAGASVSDRVASIDTLEKVGTNEYRRHLGAGAYARFDQWLRHTGTFDVQDRGTSFTPDTVPGQVAYIALPVKTGASPSYHLTYRADWNNRLWHVDAPAVSGQPRQVSILYDGNGSIQSISDPDNTAIQFGYGGGTYPVQRTAKLLDPTNFTWDELHKLRSATADFSRTSSGSVTVHFCAAESRGGATCPVTINPGRKLYTIIKSARTDTTAISHFFVNRFGAPDTIVDPLGNSTKIQRDTQFPALVKLVTAANGFQQATYWNALGLIDSTKAFAIFGTTDATTSYGWDLKWRAPIVTTSPTGVQSQAQYDAATGNLLWEQLGTSSARRTSYTYFAGTSLPSSASPPSPMGSTAYQYDAFGNDSVTTNPRGLSSTVLRDAIGRPRIVTTPIDSLGTLSRFSTYTYDAMSRTLVAVDSAPTSTSGAGASTWQSVHVTTVYDAAGQTISTSRVMGPTASSIGEIKDSVAYDAAGRVVRRYDPYRSSQPLVSWSYEPDGSRVIASSSKGTDTVTFDRLGRVSRRGISGINGDAASADSQSFHYDESGNLLNADNRYARVSRTYYASGLLQSETTQIATANLNASNVFSAHAYTNSYTYYPDGSRRTHTRPTLGGTLGATTNYAYDAATGALASIANSEVGQFTYFTGAAGQLDSLSRPDWSMERFTYRNDAIRTSRVEVGGDTLGTWHNDTFRYDARGKVLATQSTTYGTSNPSAYAYAGLGSVLSATGPQSESYVRDPLGNTISRSVSGFRSGPYENTYDPHSTRLLMMVGEPGLRVRDSVTQLFDTLGNVKQSVQIITMCPTSLACDPEDQITAWSAMYPYYAGDNRIRAVQRVTSNDDLPNEGPSVVPYAQMGRGVYEEYRYDALGRRVWRWAHRDQYCDGVDVTVVPLCSSFIERTVFDGSQVISEIREFASDSLPIAEVDAASTGAYGIVAYLNGPGVDQPLALARTRSGTAVQRLILHRNWQGAVDAASLAATGSSAGALVDCGRPNALTTGACDQIPWPGLDQSVGFQRPASNTGAPEWWGTLIGGNRNETGLIDMRARQFDPTTGTFLQEDPLGISGGVNSYSFGSGDAVNYRDPSGMKECRDGYYESPDSRGNGRAWCKPIPEIGGMTITATSSWPSWTMGFTNGVLGNYPQAGSSPSGGGGHSGGAASAKGGIGRELWKFATSDCGAAIAGVGADALAGGLMLSALWEAAIAVAAADASGVAISSAMRYVRANGGRKSLMRAGRAIAAYAEAIPNARVAVSGVVDEINQSVQGGSDWVAILPGLNLKNSIPSMIAACSSR